MNIRPTLVLILILLCGLCANATTYYFSESTGNDSWSGMLPYPDSNGNGPKQTTSAANTLLNNTAVPGDSVLFMRGDTWSGSSASLALSTCAGLINNPIVIGAYGSGSKPVFNKTSTGDIILVRGTGTQGEESAYLVFKDLYLTTNATPGSRPRGIYVNESFYTYKPHHITFDSVDVSGTTIGAVLYTWGHTMHHCHISENYNISPETGHSQGVFVSGSNMTLTGNHFENNGKPDSWFDWHLYLALGENYHVEGNEFNGHVGALKIRTVRNAVIRGNLFHDLYLTAISVGGDSDYGSSNILIESNTIHHTVDGITIKDQSGGGLTGIDTLIIRNNILHTNQAQTVTSLGDGYAGYLGITNDPVNHIDIYNNLIYNITDKYAVMIDNSNLSNGRIKNNIFHRSDTQSPLVSMRSDALNASELDANLYHCSGCDVLEISNTTFANLAQFTAQYSGQEIMGQEGDPMFVNAPIDFHLTSQSTLAVDKGADATGICDNDFDGTLRPLDGDLTGGAQWDIGPYEYNGPTGDVHRDFVITGLIAFPNPATEAVTLLSHAAGVIRIFNPVGEMVFETSIGIGQNRITWNNAGGAAGIYVIEFSGNESTTYQKLIFIK
ncbi:MAG: T9SS type A sorting domain-containing protein [Flavobacteriales bacterium]|nr:T9SS type A sorting domain-containing protein [Flavobacteriales bacterium]